MKTVLATLFVAAIVAGGSAAVLVELGVYNVAATRQHTAPVYYLMHHAMLRSVQAHAKTVRVPDLGDPRRIRDGAVLYREHCQQCHGAPGVAPDELGFGTRPSPANLVEAGRTWPAAEIYWVATHGLKMTAMPGWRYRLSEQALWDVTAFVKYLPQLSPADYARQFGVASPPPVAAPASVSVGTGSGALGDPQAGRHAIEQYLCITCHRIPGVVGADALVGPPLDGIATRTYIGGVVRNTPENMMAWLRDPQRIDPLSAMPNLRIREQDVRDIAAYLYTLK